MVSAPAEECAKRAGSSECGVHLSTLHIYENALPTAIYENAGELRLYDNAVLLTTPPVHPVATAVDLAEQQQ